MICFGKLIIRAKGLYTRLTITQKLNKQKKHELERFSNSCFFVFKPYYAFLSLFKPY